MPATPFALRLEAAYARQVADLWRRVAAIIARGYDGIDLDDLAASFRAFIPIATMTIELGQRQAQALAAAFVQQYVETEAARAYRPAPTGDGIAGTMPSGDPLPDAMASAVGVVWLGLRQGRPVREAAAVGRVYVERVAGTAVSDAAEREVAHQAERSRGLLTGWQWAVFGDTCIACLAMADSSVHSWEEPLHEHPNGDCRRLPTIVGVPENVPRPTGDDLFRSLSEEQQVALFKNAGAEKAALLREGRASLRDFVRIEDTPAGRVVTEAPLEVVA